ncbi:MAG: hypothetical protein F4210_06355 [Holophagales bacterium]|nr:hypothetical protein [Holophagales bacterium]MYF95117.1 hypothetical protein [Holophagales bacterium]
MDVAIHRAVASRDLVDRQFGGHLFAGRRGIDNLKKSGLVEEHELRDTKTARITKVLTATPAGRRLAGDVAPLRGWASDQRTWSGLGKNADLKHDLALYRAVAETRERLAERGLHLRRVRLDAEMRGEMMKRTEAVRAAHGRNAADALREGIAERLQLPLDDKGAVLWPDAQIEVAREPDGPVEGRVNIEITTEHYSRASIAAKSAAGFALFPANPKAARHLSATLSGLGSSTGGRDAASGSGRFRGEGGLLDL